MGIKIKTIFGLLAFGAIFSVLSLFDYFNAGFASSLNINNLVSKISFAVNTDYDKDGLINTDESYWNTDPNNPDTDSDGFKDGEEVASGHDPNKPGPNDKLFPDNLTERLSTLTYSGIVEGSLKPGSPNFEKSVFLVIDDALSQSTELNIKPPQELKVKENTPENIKKYQTDVMPIIEKAIKDNGNRINQLFLILESAEFFNNQNLAENNEKYTKLMRFLDEELPKIKNQINSLEASEVPAALVQLHKTIISGLKKIENNYFILRSSQQDPVKAMLALYDLIIIFTEDLPDLLTKNRFNDKI